jgi:hypothetical protein
LWMTMESQWSTDVLDPGEYEYEDWGFDHWNFQ